MLTVASFSPRLIPGLRHSGASLDGQGGLTPGLKGGERAAEVRRLGGPGKGSSV